MGISWRFIVLKWSKRSPSPYGKKNLLYLFNENLSAAGFQAAGWREWSFPESNSTYTLWRVGKVRWHELLAISRGRLNKHETVPCIYISAEKESERVLHLIHPRGDLWQEMVNVLSAMFESRLRKDMRNGDNVTERRGGRLVKVTRSAISSCLTWIC